MDAQSLMSDLLSLASGKSSKTVNHDVMSCHYGNEFIADETQHRYEALVSASSPDESDVNPADYYTMPSYISYNYFDASAAPTYISGDYRDIAPQTLSSWPGRSADVTHPLTAPSISANNMPDLPFSVDAILGRSSLSSNVSPASSMPQFQSPAAVSCNLGVPQFTFTPDDWDSFQRYRVAKSTFQQTTSSHIFWCHACNRKCAGENEARRHQYDHHVTPRMTRLRRHLFRQYGYVSAHEMTPHTKRVNCGFCAKLITTWFLARHMRSHEGHLCQICGAELSSNCRLQKHIAKCH